MRIAPLFVLFVGSVCIADWLRTMRGKFQNSAVMKVVWPTNMTTSVLSLEAPAYTTGDSWGLVLLHFDFQRNHGRTSADLRNASASVA